MNGLSYCSGPVISPQAKRNIQALISSAEKEGGEILLDGREVKVEGYPDGNWVGPTIIQGKPGMSCYELSLSAILSHRIFEMSWPVKFSIAPVSSRKEIFGPVLTVISVSSLDEAIELINSNRCEYSVNLSQLPSSLALNPCDMIILDGNGTAIFTRDGAAARRFEREVEAGQIGINTPVPVPLPMFAWSGNKGSVLGGHSLYGGLYVSAPAVFTGMTLQNPAS